MTQSPGPRAEPAPVLLVVAVLAADFELGRRAVAELADPWGGADLVGDAVSFDKTDYYAPEMGSGLSRWFVSFAQLDTSEVLVQLKQRAWQLEQRFAERSSYRRVNLDPGYLDYHKVVLASFKAGPQKLYIGQQVWADMVAYYTDGTFGPLPWTFPDMRDGPHVHFFNAARQHYKARLKRR